MSRSWRPGSGFSRCCRSFPPWQRWACSYAPLRNPAPPEAVALLVRQTSALAEKGMGKLSVGLIVSLTFALWSTNYAISTLMTALNAAYGEREKRSYVVAVATSLALT